MSEFVKEDLEKAIRIKCPSHLDRAASDSFAQQTKVWMMSPVEFFILDFTISLSMTKEFYQAVLLFKTNLKRDKKFIYSINLQQNLLKQIKTDGVDLAFSPMNSISEILAQKKTPEVQFSSSEFNVEFINPFITAVKKTLEIQCKTRINISAPYLKKEQEKGITIMGVLSLSSKGFTGSVVLGFPEAVFLKIYENMFDEKHAVISSEMEDAAGEILNIIYGVAKIELNSKGYSFDKALPTVLAGNNVKNKSSVNRPVLIIPIVTDSGRCVLEIELNKSEEKNV